LRMERSIRNFLTFWSKGLLESVSRSGSITRSEHASHSPSCINFHSLLHRAICKE
jgi:hypothetical protein